MHSNAWKCVFLGVLACLSTIKMARGAANGSWNGEGGTRQLGAIQILQLLVKGPCKRVLCETCILC